MNEIAGSSNQYNNGRQSGNNHQFDQDGYSNTDPIQPPSSVSNSSVRQSNSNYGSNLPIVNDRATNGNQFSITNPS